MEGVAEHTSRLILIRHAKSDYPVGVPDHDRPLNARGRANARVMGRTVREILEPLGAYSVALSTAIRVQETWNAMSESVPAPTRSWNDASLYLAESDAIIEAAQCASTPTVVIIGHNPGIEDLARMSQGADSARDPHTGRALRKKLPTSSVTVIEGELSRWTPEESRIVGFHVCR